MTRRETISIHRSLTDYSRVNVVPDSDDIETSSTPETGHLLTKRTKGTMEWWAGFVAEHRTANPKVVGSKLASPN